MAKKKSGVIDKEFMKFMKKHADAVIKEDIKLLKELAKH